MIVDHWTICNNYSRILVGLAAIAYLTIQVIITDRLAQLVEYRTTMQVVGSNPSWNTTQGL